MQVLSRNRAVAAALACLFGAAFVVQPLPADAQTSAGTVLFWRTMSGTVDGFTTPTGSAIFRIGDDGLHERQLTPFAKGEFNMPGVAGYENLWLTDALSPSGKFSVFLDVHSTLPVYDALSYHGKYFIVNDYGQRTSPMFYGADDLQKPSDGPGYGSVTWGPAPTNEIAYANAPDQRPARHPACVRLMHPNGSSNHTLWCAARWYYRGIEAIRWSGDGSHLLAYAVRSDRFPNPEADLYLINAATGAATLVEANVRAPYVGWGVGDVSYDAHEVIFGVVYDTHEPGPCNVASDGADVVWCAKNMHTGQTVALTDPANVVKLGLQGQVLISPDGTQAFLAGTTDPEAVNRETEIYAIKTDGSGLRQVTRPCVAIDASTSLWWWPVRVSPDGQRMLANCHTEYHASESVVRRTRIEVVNVADGNARFVTHGVAYDWHTP